MLSKHLTYPTIHQTEVCKQKLYASFSSPAGFVFRPFVFRLLVRGPSQRVTPAHTVLQDWPRAPDWLPGFLPILQSSIQKRKQAKWNSLYTKELRHQTAAGFTITLKNETYKLLVSPSVFSTPPVFSLATPIMKWWVECSSCPIIPA